jgi:O-acetyl-ADP-ribose deacetylase (regulator of RNase III)
MFRYHQKYKLAAENALHSCYRSCLQAVKENKLHSVAIPPINSEKRDYPPLEGAHIAISRRYVSKMY